MLDAQNPDVLTPPVTDVGKGDLWYFPSGLGYVPQSMGHYIANTGDAPLVFVDMLTGPRFSDVSLEQWMALIPPELLKEHLHLPDAVVAGLRKDKQFIVRAATGQG